jgi:site-specific DNA-methyltransferase (adenine-specific)
MPLLPDRSVDLICTDLPYGNHNIKWDVVIPFDKLWAQYERIIKPDGNIVLFGNGLFAYRLALSNEKLFRYDLIWKKSKCGSPFTAKYMPLKKHEMLLVFGQSAAKYNPQMAKGEPYRRKWTPNKMNNMGFGIEGVATNNKGTRHPTTILDFPQKWSRQQQGSKLFGHPTLKPYALLEWIIRSYSNEGDLVLDYCCGSGVTGIACKNNNRNYILMDTSEDYCQRAEYRIENNIII